MKTKSLFCIGLLILPCFIYGDGSQEKIAVPYPHGRGGVQNEQPPGKSKEGHWQYHYGEQYGNGSWQKSDLKGGQYDHWHGPYYCAGSAWYARGVLFVGLTFYTCDVAAIASTQTWVIRNEDASICESWPDQKNVSIMKVDNDPKWPYRLCYNDGSCVRVRPF